MWRNVHTGAVNVETLSLILSPMYVVPLCPSPRAATLGWEEGVRGVERRKKLLYVFKVSLLRQKCSNCCIQAHLVILKDLKEISLQRLKNYGDMLINVHTGEVNVQALSLIHCHPCTSFPRLTCHRRKRSPWRRYVEKCVYRSS